VKMNGGNSELPTVSLASFIGECGGCVVGDEPTPEQRLTAGQIDAVFRRHGFLYLTDFGVSEEDVRVVFNNMKRLFALNDEEKAKLSKFDPRTNTGFSKFAAEALNTLRPPDLKESFNIRSRKHYTNDYTGTPEGFGDVAESFWDKLEEASRRLFIACALAMKLPREDMRFFERTFRRFDFSTMRMLHFPPVEDFSPDKCTRDGDALRIGEHTDFGMVTLLFHDAESAGEGLQVKKADAGAGNDASGVAGTNTGWIDAISRGGATAIVNTGALIARWTNDEWRATAHRVVVPNDVAAGRDRYSLAFFLDPDKDEVIETHPRFSDAVNKYKPITSGGFVQMKIEEMLKVQGKAT
jgi:isopenicillin N synthase-like dioxygenase